MTLHQPIVAGGVAAKRIPITERPDWVAYRNVEGVHRVVHRGTLAECEKLALGSSNPALYVAHRPQLATEPMPHTAEIWRKL